MTYDSINIEELIAEELGNEPIILEADNASHEDTVSNIAERHW